MRGKVVYLGRIFTIFETYFAQICALFYLFQFLKDVFEDGVAVQSMGDPDEVTPWIMAPGDLVGQDGAVYQMGGDPIGVDQVGGSRDVPDFF